VIRIPICEGLFTWPEQPPRLIAARCTACDTVTFPAQQGCPRCTGRETVEHLLPTVGTLWSWTVQRFRPKHPYVGPDVFEPYGVGYVEFVGECIVEARLTTTDPSRLVIGTPMRLTLLDVAEGADGGILTTYAFAPEASAA
jgi:uncharacterized OB-fold protein